MFDIDLEEILIKKVGGKFALTALLQKRMVELNRGASPLVRVEGTDRSLRRIVCQEILEDKISLAEREPEGYSLLEEQARIEGSATPAPEKEESGGSRSWHSSSTRRSNSCSACAFPVLPITERTWTLIGPWPVFFWACRQESPFTRARTLLQS